MTVPIDTSMPDEVRLRLGLPYMAELVRPDDEEARGEALASQLHYHLWIERGWTGALSPIAPTLRHAGEMIRTLASEPWAESFSGSSYFPFSQCFIRAVPTAIYRGKGSMGTSDVSARERYIHPTEGDPAEKERLLAEGVSFNVTLHACDGTQLLGRSSRRECNRTALWR